MSLKPTVQYKPTVQSVKTTGATLHVEISGLGDPIIALHGGPGDSLRSIDGLLDLLTGHGQIIAFQQRGVYPSTGTSGFDVQTAIADVIAVMDSLEIEQAIIAGHSWGTLLAAFVATAHPERVRGLLLVGSPGFLDLSGWSQTDYNISHRLAPGIREKVEKMDHDLQQGTANDPKAAVDEMMRLCWPAYFADPTDTLPYKKLESNGDAYGGLYSDAARIFNTGAMLSAAPKLTMPIGFIHGIQDPIPIEHARRAANAVVNSRFIAIDKAGHMPWYEKEQETNQAVTELLNWINAS